MMHSVYPMIDGLVARALGAWIGSAIFWAIALQM
jgi:hypothetical protein